MKTRSIIILPVCSIAFTVSCGVSDRLKMRDDNEAAAAGSINVISAMQRKYADANQGKYAKNFDQLIESQNLNALFSGENPVVKNFVFVMKVKEATLNKPAFFSINADPQAAQVSNSATKVRHFYTDSVITSIKYTEENRPATADDPSI